MFDAVVWNNPWVRAVCTVLALVLAGVTLYLLNFVLVPLFIAFIVAYIFNPIIKRVEAHKVSRMAAIIGVLALILTIIVSVPLIIIPSMIQEAKEFAKPRQVAEAPADVPQEEAAVEGEAGQTDADATTEETPRPHIYAGLGPFEASVMQPIVELMAWEPLENESKPSMVVRRKIGEEIGNQSEAVLAMIRDNAGTLFGLGRSSVQSVAGAVLTVWGQVLELGMLLGNIVLFTFVTVYLLRDYNAVLAVARGLMPERFRAPVARILSDIDRQLKAFFRGQLMVCACLGTMYCIGLSIAGTPFALPLGIFGGIVSFVPFLGIALTIGPAVLLTLLSHGLDWHILVVLLTFLVAQVLEGNFLTPKIVGSQVGLGPVWVILSVMTFGTTLGFKGLLIAVPLAATLKVLVIEALKYYKSTSFFTGPPADAS